MAKDRIDGVVEAVRYDQDGFVKWVRAYLRRGPTYSDHEMIDRQTLLDHLKTGKRLYAGKRIPLKASTFEITKSLHVIQQDGREVLVTGDIHPNKDCLDGIPII